MNWQNGEFTISTDRNLLQLDAIQKFLSEESYWAKTRTREQTETAIKNSLPFGVYKGENQIGFARVVTDYATFAYLGDVYILENLRGTRFKQMADGSHIESSRFAGLPALDSGDEGRA